MRKRSNKLSGRTDIRNKLIKDFFETIKDKYSDYTYAQIEAACRAPYIQMKHELRKGTMREIRLPHLGTLSIRPSKVVSQLLIKKRQFEEGNITQHEYREFVEMMRRRIIIAKPHFEEGVEKLGWDFSHWFDLENIENGDIRNPQQCSDPDPINLTVGPVQDGMGKVRT